MKCVLYDDSDDDDGDDDDDAVSCCNAPVIKVTGAAGINHIGKVSLQQHHCKTESKASTRIFAIKLIDLHNSSYCY